MELGRSGGVQGDRTDRTNTQTQISRDLVLHDIRKSTFRKYWNFNVLEMALKTFHFVPGLSRTPLLFIPRYLTNVFFRKYFPTKTRNLQIWKSQKSILESFLKTRPMQGWESEWGWGVGEKKYEFQSQIFGFSDLQIVNFRFYLFLKICLGKYVGEISKNK